MDGPARAPRGGAGNKRCGMINPSADNSSLFAGRLQGIEMRIHILAPLSALVVLLLVMKTDLAPQPEVAAWALLVLFGSVALYEVARVATAMRIGGHTTAIVLGPIGGLSKLHLPPDPTAHLMTALAGPITYLTLLVAAGCGLALGNDRSLFQLLLNPCAPHFADVPIGASTITLEVFAQLVVWVNWCLLLVSILPVDPCAGAELLRGTLWPIVGRTTATSATSRVALGAAVFFAMLAFLIPESSARVPSWFPLSVISIFLLYGGARQVSLRRYDVGLAIDQFDSDDEEWLLTDWDDEDREAVLVEHLQDKQQEALDRKRREREAYEDARVDAILQRLRDTSFDQLSEEDRATLKRASRRYRERRETDLNES